MIARSTLGEAMDGDVNFKIGILMMSMFFGGFIGSNLAGLLIDRFKKFKLIGICAICAGKIYFKITRVLWTSRRNITDCEWFRKSVNSS